MAELDGPVRVVVADDSMITRILLRDVLERDGDILVVGEASDAATTLEAVQRTKPDLATVDVYMPGGGLRAIEWVMAHAPVPILVVTSAGSEGDGPTLAFEAVRRGALDLIAKPRGSRDEDAQGLRAAVRRLARLPVVRHMTGPRSSPPLARPSRPRAPGTLPPRPDGTAPRARGTKTLAVVGVASSAGGPGAVAELLGALPRDFRACIALVQHVGPGFAEPFARFVAAHTSLRVVVATGRVMLEPGLVVVASEGAHLVALDSRSLLMIVSPKVDGHRPSGTVLLQSLAAAHGPAAAGVILSGMGSDGAEGLRALRLVGGVTFAQSKQSAAVYGMPRAAVEYGVVDHVMTPEEIAGALVEATRSSARS